MKFCLSVSPTSVSHKNVMIEYFPKIGWFSGDIVLPAFIFLLQRLWYLEKGLLPIFQVFGEIFVHFEDFLPNFFLSAKCDKDVWLWKRVTKPLFESNLRLFAIQKNDLQCSPFKSKPSIYPKVWYVISESKILEMEFSWVLKRLFFFIRNVECIWNASSSSAGLSAFSISSHSCFLLSSSVIMLPPLISFSFLRPCASSLSSSSLSSQNRHLRWAPSSTFVTHFQVNYRNEALQRLQNQQKDYIEEVFTKIVWFDENNFAFTNATVQN